MKIMYFLAHPNSIGGAMKVLMTQAHIMKTRGTQVKVVIQNDEKDSHIPEYDKLCEQFQLDYLTAQYPISTCIEEIDILECLEAYDRLYEIISQYHPDIVHSVQINGSVELVTRALQIPHLMNIYPASEDMFHIKWLNILPLFQSGDSEYFCKRWANGLNIETKCIRVAYQPRVSSMRKIKSKFDYELVNIASFGEHKQQLEIIKFIEICKSEKLSVHINFVGNNVGIYGDKCKEYVKQHKLENEVSFIGQVLNIEDYLSMADLMVHASISESYPGVIVEAMGNGVPILATPIAGIPELMIDGENGFLTEGCTCEELYKAFERYIRCLKENDMIRIIENAYQTYLKNHTYEHAGNSLDDYYVYILSKKSIGTLKYQEVKLLFDDFTKYIQMNSISQETRKRIWYLYHISKIVKEKAYKKIYIWGAGNWGKIALEWCDILNVNVCGYIDSFKNGEYLGYPVTSLEKVHLTKEDLVLVAVVSATACRQIMETLENLGRTRNIDYFFMCNNPCL